jgi:formylglycine-generating enzyme required for sulfatase activity
MSNRASKKASISSKAKLLILLVPVFCILPALVLNERSPAAKAESPASLFAPTKENATPKPVDPPLGMVWIPGGEFSMGANDPPAMDAVGMKASMDARPVHRVYVDGFLMDKTDVTNAEFEEFVKATGYVTVAEQRPRAEDFPGAPAENLVAGSVVFSAPDHPVPLDSQFRWWSYVAGAIWRHPLGLGAI